MNSLQRYSGVTSLIAWPALLSGCGAAAPPPPPPPPAVTATTVIMRPLRQWDDFTGRLEAVDSVEIRPRVSGFVDAISFSEGARVGRGQLLFQIDPRPYRDEVERLAAELRRAEAKQVLAKSDAARGKRLIDQNAVSQGEFERLGAEAASASADVGAARAALNTARLNLSFTRVVSPVAGRVSKAIITRGNLVTASSLLTTVVSDSPIYASFNADEQAYLKYAGDQRGKGGPVFVGLINEQGFPHRGRLHFLDNVVDSGSGTIQGRAILDNPDGKLTPGLFSRIRLVSSGTKTIALVPEQSLGTDLGKRFVMILDRSNHVRTRPVELGAALGEFRIVTSGLVQGEQVVVDGLQKVKSGDAVKAVRKDVPIPQSLMDQLAPVG
ncbi:efflux RND transporter periplasmic adaptor subunit [Sphingomonas glacialis]|uniref:Efflux RND transporter periplasmic adaptor subunit n=2 Tax=Sphingomonas glacialis TaxID=658225 RepID=A0A502FRA0_9SPHN|nr:efflux RND transporter periplasmic adaptor subunit [Sphingomonas glacialis]